MSHSEDWHFCTDYELCEECRQCDACCNCAAMRQGTYDTGEWREPADRKIAAATDYLQQIPLEERVPGYGGGLSAPDKAEILALLNEEEP
jgi:MinD superfamily P-loop ATPase